MHFVEVDVAGDSGENYSGGNYSEENDSGENEVQEQFYLIPKNILNTECTPFRCYLNRFSNGLFTDAKVDFAKSIVECMRPVLSE